MQRKRSFCAAVFALLYLVPGTMLQEQLDELRRGPEAEDDCKQEPEPAGGVIPDNAGGNNDNTD